MNPVMEDQILEGFRDSLIGRELATVEVMPIQPIDARFDPEDPTEDSPFPYGAVHLGDSEVLDENTSGLLIGFNVRVEATLLQQSENMRYAFTIVAKHIMERLMFQRQRPNLQGTDRGQPFDLPFVRELIPVRAETAGRESTAATATFTRSFNFLVTYQTTYDEIQKYVPTR